MPSIKVDGFLCRQFACHEQFVSDQEIAFFLIPKSSVSFWLSLLTGLAVCHIYFAMTWKGKGAYFRPPVLKIGCESWPIHYVQIVVFVTGRVFLPTCKLSPLAPSLSLVSDRKQKQCSSRQLERGARRLLGARLFRSNSSDVKSPGLHFSVNVESDSPHTTR